MTQVITIDMIEKSINEATQILPIIWPLKASIAINPLWDLTDKPFDEALNHIRNYLPVNGCLTHDEYLKLYKSGKISKSALKSALLANKKLSNDEEDIISTLFTLKHEQEIDYSSNDYSVWFPKHIKEEISIFISRYFDQTQVKACAKNVDFSLWQEWKQQKLFETKRDDFLIELPLDPLHALHNLLNKMQISEKRLTIFFKCIFSQLIGWHGFIKWLESRKNNPLIRENASLVEILLIWCCRLHMEKVKLDEKSLPFYAKPLSDFCSQNEILLIWQHAYELTYQESLLAKLKTSSVTESTPIAQFVFCIDVRSEPIRRHLESFNRYETFGYAGFFGSIFTLEESTNTPTLQAPALVEPNMSVHKKAPSLFFSKLISDLNIIVNQAKNKNFSAFAFFEMVGALLLFPLLQKTFFAKQSEMNQEPALVCSNPFLAVENIKQTLKNMCSFLKTIGLTKKFAPVVVICGHQAKTTNNPFHASFECGACGGNSGFINAKITCEILNNSEIRKMLISEGIDIPQETIFVAAYHETTTDKLKLVPDKDPHPDILKQIESDVEQAIAKLKKEREASFIGCNGYHDKAYHYAELIPEWGLANNAAIIIGPRSLTANTNLNSRVFLHSYEPEEDADASILEGILMAPMIVAHWINAQYYFSATDPHVYGAGNKALHNVVSKIGVMEGNQSDLKIGLPLQSMFFKNQRVHEPLKLLVVIYASSSQINEVFRRQPHIKALFDYKWINLHVISPRKNNYVTG